MAFCAKVSDSKSDLLTVLPVVTIFCITIIDLNYEVLSKRLLLGNMSNVQVKLIFWKCFQCDLEIS